MPSRWDVAPKGVAAALLSADRHASVSSIFGATYLKPTPTW
ncbi:MAG: hypothetical protein RMK65_10320 [Anaerolineae bacterium]|nr:hypothetical protein [Anaerolineae bacterium]